MSSTTPHPEPVEFSEPGIRLGQFLKYVNAVEDGQEAKAAIANGMVKLNGDIDERRGAQLHAGDVVEFNGEAWRVEIG